MFNVFKGRLSLMSDYNPKKILILFAHPAMQKSKVNKRLVEPISALEGVTFHDLYDSYPDMYIDVEREKDLLLENDIIIFQHPFYWYSSPAMLKEWQDLVLEFGFAYGPGGTALEGKKMMNVISTGASREAYRREGHNTYTIREFLRPFEQTANLCHMKYLPPFVLHDAINMDVNMDLLFYSELLRNMLTQLINNKIDFKELEDFEYFNDYFVDPEN